MEQIQKQHSKKEAAEIDNPPCAIKDEELDQEIDDLLADIDEVLVEVGEEFALQYVQQGGQ
jgi:ubiquitin-like protein Pup